MSIQVMQKLVLKYLPALAYTKYRRQRSVNYTATPYLSQPKAFTKQ